MCCASLLSLRTGDSPHQCPVFWCSVLTPEVTEPSSGRTELCLERKTGDSEQSRKEGCEHMAGVGCVNREFISPLGNALISKDITSVLRFCALPSCRSSEVLRSTMRAGETRLVPC